MAWDQRFSDPIELPGRSPGSRSPVRCASRGGCRGGSHLVARTGLSIWEADRMGAKSLILLARPKRSKLLTPRFVVWCSPNSKIRN
jgi:hypothetical protein